MTRISLYLLWFCAGWGCSGALPPDSRALQAEPPAQTASPAVIPAVTEELMHASHWLASQPHIDDLLLPAEQLEEYQQELRQGSHGSLVDLAAFPLTLASQALIGRLTAWAPEVETIFQEGKALGPEQLQGAIANLNQKAVAAENPVRWGVTRNSTSLRLWPVAQGWYDRADDDHFDMLQGSMLDPSEPVAVLHASLDGAWLFVRASHSDGWVAAANVAITSHEEWLTWVMPTRFLVVTGSALEVSGPDIGPLRYRMGARLPISSEPWPERMGKVSTAGNWVVRLPAVDAYGALTTVLALVPVSACVHLGYLPYTQRNLLELAFRFLGEGYGWGGRDGGEDCSYLVAMVYRCFGLTLPRNSWYQEQLPAIDHPISGQSWSDVQAVLDTLPAGASLHLRGHVMLYLGKDSGRYYVLHALAAYGEGSGAAAGGQVYAPGAPELEKRPAPRRIDVMRVVVSDLDLIRTNGSSMALSLTKAKVYAKP